MSPAKTGGIALDEIDQQQPDGAWATLVRGLRLSPEFRVGLPVTLLLAGVTTVGRVVVPVTVQQVIDRGLRGEGGPDLEVVVTLVLAALATIVVTSVAGYVMNYRLARSTETALSALRVRAFRHIHDLSMLHHATEHRGALVSRVTSDVDTISQFMQWGGVVLLVNLGQLLVATAVMAYYSPSLTLLVILSFAPLVFILQWFQRRLSVAYDLVRRRVGELMTAIAESVVGAAVIRAYHIQDRTDRRIDSAVEREYTAQRRAARLSTTMFSTAEIFSGLATAAVVVVGVQQGVAGELTEGRLVAFLFLVTLFVSPVQVATEVLNEVQTAIAGWRRILNVLDTEPDVVDPQEGVEIPPGPIGITFSEVVFSYPSRDADEAPVVLHPLSLTLQPQTSVAIVGETGSGKTTFAKLLTRLMDPTEGRILINGAPLRDVSFASLRRRVVMVPQDGFLFDMTIAENVRHGRSDVSDEGVRLAFLELGLADWAESLPRGIHTRVGERGEALSVGERRLVALARAYVAGPDLLVLDEATSAVDPATEVRIQRALDGLTRGRTSVAIAHRLSTAEAADEVLVFDAGRLVQRGHHSELLTQEGPYAALHASWVAGSVGILPLMQWDLPYPSRRQPVLADAAVATSQPLAVQAGVAALRDGGNAVDAAIAAAAALTVVEPTSNGIGGDLFAIVWDGTALHGLNASGRSPAGIDVGRLLAGGSIPLRGWDSVTVPGAVSGWVALHERFARLELGRLLAPAAIYAEQGYLVGPVTAAAWLAQAMRSAHCRTSRRSCRRVAHPPLGERFAFPAQAATLRAIAESNGETFYRGRVAEQIAAHAAANGAALRGSDMAAHTPQWVDTLAMPFGNTVVHELPPNGQGIAALEALGVLAHHDLAGLDPDGPDSIHLQAEAMKIAFADAHGHVADPDHMRIDPGALLDPAYLARRAAEVDTDRASDPAAAPAHAFQAGGTVYLCAADADGMMVSLIQSNYYGFGSGVVVPDTGISLQNRGAGFSVDPGHPNVVAPSKRPFHTIIPAMACDPNGRATMAFGVMGGHMQPQGHVQMVLRTGLWGQNPQAALDAPRWRVEQGRDLALEAGVPDTVRSAMRDCGHQLLDATAMGGFGGGQIVMRHADGWLAASDPRKEGHAAGL